jgi:hypothetical protein
MDSSKKYAMLGTAVNTYALITIAVPVVLVGFLYWTITPSDFQNYTVHTVVADDGTITTKRTIP